MQEFPVEEKESISLRKEDSEQSPLMDCNEMKIISFPSISSKNGKESKQFHHISIDSSPCCDYINTTKPERDFLSSSLNSTTDSSENATYSKSILANEITETTIKSNQESSKKFKKIKINQLIDNLKSVTYSGDINLMPETPALDRWREVEYGSSGRSYFYNTRTRESKWSLPANAILLEKKRKLGGKNGYLVSGNPCREVSSPVTDIFVPTEDMFDSFEDITVIQSQDSKKLSNLSPSNMSHSDTDNGNREIYTKVSKPIDELKTPTFKVSNGVEPDDMINGYMQLQKTINSTQKKLIFSPEDERLSPKIVDDISSSQSNDDSEGISMTSPKNHHIAHDNQEYFKCFCIYCGHMCSKQSEMVYHMNHCVRLMRYQSENPELAFLIQRTLLDFWGTDTNWCKPQTVLHETLECNDKENIPLRINLPQTQQDEHVDVNHLFKTHSEDTCSSARLVEEARSEKKFVENDITTPAKLQENNPKLNDASDVDQPQTVSMKMKYENFIDCCNSLRQDEIEAKNDCHIFSFCPFCSRSFEKGNKLSSHLLKCRARIKSGKKRRMTNLSNKNNNSWTTYPITKKEGSDSLKQQNSLQKRLLLKGGRHLSGYPKLASPSSFGNY